MHVCMICIYVMYDLYAYMHRACMYVRTCLCEYDLYVCMYVCMYVRMYVCMYVHVYICMGRDTIYPCMNHMNIYIYI